ncbi:uncharacterized protein LOC128965252 [Oppia nitens]|uniref:uncharacterized protein LOC128965252 n=1 Tax=Oppia nitens TaxID=1686743 RepID=UPI0023DB8BC5|nr:uncharacterized protein LOC128965252 [Oppia nitens]
MSNTSDLFDDIKCGICLDIVSQPVLTQCCRHLYCNGCIRQWLTGSRTGTTDTTTIMNGFYRHEQRRQTCPMDRRPLTVQQLMKPSILVSNLLIYFNRKEDIMDYIDEKQVDNKYTEISRILFCYKCCRLPIRRPVARKCCPSVLMCVKCLANDDQHCILCNSSGQLATEANVEPKRFRWYDQIIVRCLNLLPSEAAAAAMASTSSAASVSVAIGCTFRGTIGELRGHLDGNGQCIGRTDRLCSTCNGRISEHNIVANGVQGGDAAPESAAAGGGVGVLDVRLCIQLMAKKMAEEMAKIRQDFDRYRVVIELLVQRRGQGCGGGGGTGG